MKVILVIIMVFFWTMLIYYSLLTIAGVIQRIKHKTILHLNQYPSVAVFVPAYNEGVVIKNTLDSMVALKYSGELNIYILDDQSTDDTAEIVKEYSRTFSQIHYLLVPNSDVKGKSSVLNYGLSVTDSEYFLVFDGDNQPEENAVMELVHAAETTKKSAGAVGYVKTINADSNLLTRMIALEFQVFQLLMQSGRWGLLRTGSLAGTNMLLRRSVLEDLGGYDPYALAEDAELTIRVAAKGLLLPVVHHARTWEQEPEKLRNLIRQRTRWLTGNLYLLEKSFQEWKFWKGRTIVHSLHHLMTYFLFVIFLFISNLWFYLGLFGIAMPNVDTPLLILWFMSYIVYTGQLFSAMVLEDTLTPKNIVVGIIMYFTYAQLFLILLFKSIFQFVSARMRKKTIKWDKTTRHRQGAG
nr:glycosyltransferase [Gracilibacillus ureilyticus]